MLNLLSLQVFWIPLIIVLSFVSRLPQLMSPYFHLDGDECVVGLMAQHMARGSEFPFYFWGQHYGFSWIEAGVAALSFKIFGVGVYSLKIPMLCLWSLGCVFFYCALAHWTSKFHAFLMTVVLIFSPAWMAWSMMARGGYVTAFLLFNIFMFIIARKSRQSNLSWLLAGIVLGFMFFSQAMFLIAALPLMVYALKKQRDLKGAGISILGFTAVFILGKAMAVIQPNTDFWNPVVIKPGPFWGSISALWFKFHAALDQYALSRSGKIDWASYLITQCWVVVFLTSLIKFTTQLKSKSASFNAIFLISIAFVLGSTFILNREIFSDRYLLSFSVALVVWFGIQSFQWIKESSFLKILSYIILSIFIFLGLCAAWNYKDYYRYDPKSTSEVPEMQKIPKVIDFLRTEGVKEVYSIDDDLSWKVSFFSEEQIVARWMRSGARQPAYNSVVDRALFNGQRVALIGNAVDQRLALMIVASEGRVSVIADQYFVELAPTIDMIINKMRFEVAGG